MIDARCRRRGDLGRARSLKAPRSLAEISRRRKNPSNSRKQSEESHDTRMEAKLWEGLACFFFGDIFPYERSPANPNVIARGEQRNREFRWLARQYLQTETPIFFHSSESIIALPVLIR